MDNLNMDGILASAYPGQVINLTEDDDTYFNEKTAAKSTAT